MYNHKKYSFSSPLGTGPLRPGCEDYKSIPSRDSKVCLTAKSATLYYTGDELLGIATMHKSNAVPITRGSEMAIATARMRRG